MSAGTPPNGARPQPVLNGQPVPGPTTNWTQDDWRRFDAFNETVHNALMIRKDWVAKYSDPRRNVEDECGYPRLEDSIGADLYRMYYDRDSIANRVCEVLPKESWQVQPMVYESEAADDITDFERDWDAIGKTLVNGSSWYNTEEGSPVWEYLLRADIRSGIGHFGVILLGLDDHKNLMEPVDGVQVFNEGYITPEEEKALREPKPYTYTLPSGRERTITPPALNALEQMCLNQMIEKRTQVINEHRQRIHNAVRDDQRDGPADPTSRAVSSTGQPLGTEAFGTDSQYPNMYGLGMDGQSPIGTDQQYMGIQFGASEAFKEAPSGKRKLLFLRVFDESLIQIVRYEWNINNPRFGQPVMYRITLNDPREQHTGIGLPLATVFVHWSRVIHVAENIGSNSEHLAAPRMRPVLNNVLGLHKVYCADPEAYWKNCLTKLILETHPQLGGDVSINTDDLRNQLENFNNGLQPYLALMGMAAKTVPPTLADPQPHVNVQIEAICIQLGIPVRVFKGSERGELASSQDDSSWNDRLRHRQLFYITPKIIVRFIDRLIQIGVLSQPKTGGKPTGITKNRRTVMVRVRNAQTGEMETKTKEVETTSVTTDIGYTIEWPDLDSLTDIEKAQVLLTKTQAYAAYIQGNVASMIPELDYMTKFDNLSDEQATAILEEAEKKQEEQMQEDADLAEEHGMIPTPPDGFEHPQPPPPAPPAVKLRAGETLHKPGGGEPIAKGPPMPKPNGGKK